MNNPMYHIAVRIDCNVGFVLIGRTDAGYEGRPKSYLKEEMLREYAQLVVEHGAKNVVVSQAAYFYITGRVEEVPETHSVPRAKAGAFEYEEKSGNPL